MPNKLWPIKRNHLGWVKYKNTTIRLAVIWKLECPIQTLIKLHTKINIPGTKFTNT